MHRRCALVEHFGFGSEMNYCRSIMSIIPLWCLNKRIETHVAFIFFLRDFDADIYIIVYYAEFFRFILFSTIMRLYLNSEFPRIFGISVPRANNCVTTCLNVCFHNAGWFIQFANHLNYFLDIYIYNLFFIHFCTQM